MKGEEEVDHNRSVDNRYIHGLAAGTMVLGPKEERVAECDAWRAPE